MQQAMISARGGPAERIVQSLCQFNEERQEMSFLFEKESSRKSTFYATAAVVSGPIPIYHLRT